MPPTYEARVRRAGRSYAFLRATKGTPLFDRTGEKDIYINLRGCIGGGKRHGLDNVRPGDVIIFPPDKLLKTEGRFRAENWSKRDAKIKEGGNE